MKQQEDEKIYEKWITDYDRRYIVLCVLCISQEYGQRLFKEDLY